MSGNLNALVDKRVHYTCHYTICAILIRQAILELKKFPRFSELSKKDIAIKSTQKHHFVQNDRERLLTTQVQRK
jgi:hypothetical protein